MAGAVQTRRAVDGAEPVAGDVVRTTDDPTAIAEIQHRSGAVSRLDAESEVAVDLDEASARPRIVVTVGPGRTWHRTGPLGDLDGGDATLLEVRCPGAVLTARFACFALSCAPDGTTSVTAVDGNVVVRGQSGGSVALADGQRARVGADGVVAGVDEAVDLAADPWIALNQSLDGGLPLPSTPAAPTPVAESTSPADVDSAKKRPWVVKAGVGGALAVVALAVGAGLLR